MCLATFSFVHRARFTAGRACALAARRRADCGLHGAISVWGQMNAWRSIIQRHRVFNEERIRSNGARKLQLQAGGVAEALSVGCPAGEPAQQD
jgi:hypothetical protein